MGIKLTYLLGITLKVFENRVLRRIFGPKREEVTGGWRKLDNEKLHNLYSSPKIKEDEMGRAYGINGKCTQGLVIKYEAKRLLGRHGHKWEDNIKIDLKVVEL
jgi:hypothetical protein